ncbi:MAG: DUF3343 domain-containing protein [Candidatus Delongbacteria bacterium]|nr:DUF3343 domain-containing protein [Candidatus Delongbacteria bacterium]
MSEFSVILFHSSNYAMWTKDILSENDLDCKMISVPRDLSSDCGYCVKFLTAEKEQVELFLEKNEIEFDKIVDV